MHDFLSDTVNTVNTLKKYEQFLGLHNRCISGSESNHIQSNPHRIYTLQNYNYCLHNHENIGKYIKHNIL